MNEATTRKPSKKYRLPVSYPTAEELIPKSIKSCYLTVINPRLKAAEHVIWNAEHINYYSIYDAYNRPSYAKQNAWDDCDWWIHTIAEEAEGRIQEWGVVGASSMEFSVGARIYVPKAEATIYVYITRGANKVVVKSDNHDHYNFAVNVDLSEVKIFED